VWGDCHRELFSFWQLSDVDAIDNTLALMPRDHQKSHALAVRCAWEIYKDPAITIIYLSATSGLAERQLLDIQNIMESRYFRRLSPDMIHKDKGKRSMWNTTGISVDHPKREAEGVRDPTVSTCGLTTNTTGWHCIFLAKDDVVVPDNAYTIEGRKKVESGCSQFASILTTGGKECAVGTRYHPKDHYATLKVMTEPIRNEYDEIIDEHNVYAVHERQVEIDGVFLWPREARKSDGKMFGFNFRELDRKKAKYTDRLQFFAQYYNNPNDLENRSVERGNFKYYKREHIFMHAGHWHYGKGSTKGYEGDSRRLNVYAAMDFAFSKSKRADYTCIVVFGIDWEFNVYILDIIRFKTNKTSIYFSNFKDMLIKWEFSRLRAEVTAAQEVIVQSLKDKAMEEGIHCRIESHRPNKYDGAKEERMEAALLPRYEEGKVYHYKGGLCTYLEEEILLDNPEHDDIKNTLADGLSSEYIRKPRKPSRQEEMARNYIGTVKYHSRFGGCV
jgi:phage terminase large subunit-like protein